MKNYLFIIVIGLSIISWACNEEEPVETSADFSTNITDGTLAEGEDFTMYLERAEGEFLTYFRGADQSTVFDPEEPLRQGEVIDTELDSMQVTGYTINADTIDFQGEKLINDTIDGVVHKDFVFTLVASSSGNWSEDYDQDVKSMRITVTKQLEE